MKNLRISVRLALGFASVLVLTLALGILCVLDARVLGGLTDKLYKHPLTVSTAALSANGNIVAMHRSMKDVALAKDNAGIDAAAARVAELEKLVLADFDILRERFLGDPAMVADARSAVVDWKPIRDEVIEFMKNDKRAEAAAITKAKGAAQVKLISDRMDALISFARSKADEFHQNAMKKLSEITLVISAFLVGALLTGAAFAFAISRGITNPITALCGVMAHLAQGKLETEVTGCERKDEIGDMAKAVEVFKDNAVNMKRLEREQEEAKARAEVEKRETMNRMAESFEASVGKVVESVSAAAAQLNASSKTMSSAAERAASQSSAVAAASEQAAANVQTVASAAEELASSISEISRQVTESTKIAGDAVVEAKRSNDMVNGLSEAAKKVGTVVNLITDIAEQTNLLALNATIEAARAGDAGKGFAVVASEVKNLANQTARATDEIASQIADIQSATMESAQAISGISETIHRISEIAAAISAAVEEQGAATSEIARNVEQAATGTQEVSENISGVTSSVGETESAADQVNEAAGSLGTQSTLLKEEVARFLEQVRAA
ncbi:MAG: methyl-accepting chemotaxis protein [Rhodospirillales bacterium CG15_BIG_FIL_POST_REV_8_21_14_020_66_15]|nr:MAG: methyl-accepting chemotaxis protein [Rhodospirillales bacterium CG15_BIG_FIL_POST_REV_8_21_14_020_66_15]